MPTWAELHAGLLGASDVPGYTAQPGGVSIADSSLSGCPTLATDPPGEDANATEVLTDQTTGATISEALLQMAPGTAGPAITALGGIPGSCPHFTGVISGFDVAFSSAALALSRVGDQTVATRITALVSVAGQTVTVYEDVVAVQHGNTVIVVINAGTSADTASTQRVAGIAYAKVAALW